MCVQHALRRSSPERPADRRRPGDQPVARFKLNSSPQVSSLFTRFSACTMKSNTPGACRLHRPPASYLYSFVFLGAVGG